MAAGRAVFVLALFTAVLWLTNTLAGFDPINSISLVSLIAVGLLIWNQEKEIQHYARDIAVIRLWSAKYVKQTNRTAQNTTRETQELRLEVANLKGNNANLQQKTKDLEAKLSQVEESKAKEHQLEVARRYFYEEWENRRIVQTDEALIALATKTELAMNFTGGNLEPVYKAVRDALKQSPNVGSLWRLGKSSNPRVLAILGSDISWIPAPPKIYIWEDGPEATELWAKIAPKLHVPNATPG